MPSKNSSELFMVLSLGAQLGFMVAIPIAGFLFLGNLLDNYFKISPLFLLVGLILGFIFTIVGVYELLAPFIKKNGEIDEDKLDIYDQH